MANVPQLGAPGGDDDSQEMPTCKHCGQAIFFEHAADCPVIQRQLADAKVAPIPLNRAQIEAVQEWAADYDLWGSRSSIEFNLFTFARVILKHSQPMCGEDHLVGERPQDCFACLSEQRDALLEVARIEQALQMRGYTKATAKSLGVEAEMAHVCGGTPGLNDWRRRKREAAIAKAEGR